MWALLGVGYFLLAAMTIRLTSNGRDHATIWVADALVLALLLDLPKRAWKPVLLVGVLANTLANDVTRGFDIRHAIYGSINIGQVWVAAHFLQRRLGGPSLLSDIKVLGRFVLWAGIITPVIGGVLGSLASIVIYQQPFVSSFERWFFSNALGFVVATPFFKSVWDGSYLECFRGKTPLQRLRMMALLLAYTGLVILVFVQEAMPLLFMPLGALVLLTFPLGRHGIKVALLITAIVGALATLAGHGPLALMRGDWFEKSVFFQFYLAMTLATCMTVAAIISSRADFLVKLNAREQSIRTILASSPDVVLGFDGDGQCIFAGGPTDALLGEAADSLTGRSLAEMARQWPELGAVVRSSAPVMEIQTARGLWVESTRVDLDHDGINTGSVITFHNVNARSIRERELHRKAYTDDLTQVLNRAGFHQRVDEALKEGETCSLALIDVDYFKSINDRFGHSKGDEVLARIGACLMEETRAEDIVGRIGGDEFAILFRADGATAVKVCNRILERCAILTQQGREGHLQNVTLSCGVAETVPGQSKSLLFRTADEALYDVKAAGRNAVRRAA